MLKKIVKDVNGSREDAAEPPRPNPFAGVNPDAFSVETDRARTQPPFKRDVKQTVEDLRALYSQEASRTVKKPKKQSRSTPPNRLNKVIVVFILIFCLGAYFFVQQDSASDSNQDSIELTAGNESISESIESDSAQSRSTYLEEASTFDEPGSIGDFIASSKINGVFIRGEKSAITLNGTTYRTGDVVSDDFGLVFIGFHRDRKRAVFQGPDNLYYLMSIR